LTRRIASALVMAPLALAAAWFGTPFLPVLVALAAAGMGREWARLSGATAAAPTSVTMATALAAVAAVSLGAPVIALLLAFFGTIAVWVAAIVTKSRAPVWTAAGTLWFVLPCIALLWVAAGPHGRAAIFFLLAIVWASDIGAYAAGRAIGGPRLAPMLSPNKTWAGACGGLVGCALVGLATARLMGGSGAVVVAASLVLSLAAQLGDLAESFAKRKFGVKDSGSLIPGHGGLLDRLDSLLTAAALLGLLLLLGAGAALGWSP
jgi:phosphatidate cytidylyltransferase